MFHDDMYGHVPGKRKPLATAALVLGILSIILSFIIYLALPLGALSIILAILSHTEYKMAKKSRIGLICGICGILASVVITVTAFRYALTDPAMRTYLEYYIQMYVEELNDSTDIFSDDVSDPSSILQDEIPQDEILQDEVPQEGGVFL